MNSEYTELFKRANVEMVKILIDNDFQEDFYLQMSCTFALRRAFRCVSAAMEKAFQDDASIDNLKLKKTIAQAMLFLSVAQYGLVGDSLGKGPSKDTFDEYKKNVEAFMLLKTDFSYQGYSETLDDDPKDLYAPEDQCNEELSCCDPY